MVQLRHHCLHMGANLFRRPVFGCHVFHAKINQLLFAGVGECTVGIAPLAVFLIKRTIRLLAGCGIVKRHAAALANQLPGSPQQCVDRNIKEQGKPVLMFPHWALFHHFPNEIPPVLSQRVFLPIHLVTALALPADRIKSPLFPYRAPPGYHCNTKRFYRQATGCCGTFGGGCLLKRTRQRRSYSAFLMGWRITVFRFSGATFLASDK